MIDINNYNDENIFAKILRNEIPCKKILENNEILAFEDINPQAPIHILIIPKKKFCSLKDFTESAEPILMSAIFKAINDITKKFPLKNGYRLVCNTGEDGSQEVPHLHFHILGGRQLGKILP